MILFQQMGKNVLSFYSKCLHFGLTALLLGWRRLPQPLCTGAGRGVSPTVKDRASVFMPWGVGGMGQSLTPPPGRFPHQTPIVRPLPHTWTQWGSA